MSDFVMPSLGADMESGKLIQWLVTPGQAVNAGDVVAVVETHKGAFEIEVFENGVVSDLCAEPGEELPVGAVLAHLETGADHVDRPQQAPETRIEPAPPLAPAPMQRDVPSPSSRVRISPVARQRARALGIDPGTLHGTGIDGAVTLQDVEGAKTQPPSLQPAPGKGFDPAQMRQAIAAAMARSKREIPHYYLETPIDMSRALSWLESFNADRPPDQRLLPAVLLMKASALAIHAHPQFNGFWKDERFQPAPGIHVGWAIALRGGGLVAPAIHDVDVRPIPELMDALRDLVTRARTGRLRGSEMMDPTITITSLGERGAETVHGIIYPPQVALIGFGRIGQRPWAADDDITARPVVTATLAADHRASDGHAGGLFLSEINSRLQEPESL